MYDAWSYPGSRDSSNAFSSSSDVGSMAVQKSHMSLPHSSQSLSVSVTVLSFRAVLKLVPLSPDNPSALLTSSTAETETSRRTTVSLVASPSFWSLMRVSPSLR